MAGSYVGEALVSVADVKMLDTKTGVEIGEAIALTSSGIESTTQNVEVSGGFLNSLLFDIRFGRRVNLTLESATFKMEYLAFQTGTVISRAVRNVYEFNDCQTAATETLTLKHTPTDKVHVVYDDGNVEDLSATANTITIPTKYVGTQVMASYYYGGEFENITVDATTEPMTVTLLMNIRSRKQNGTTGTYQVSIPLFKFDGNFNLTFTSDGVSAMSIAGSSLAYTQDCGKMKYCDWTYIPDDPDTYVPAEIIAVPSKYSLSVGQKVTPYVVGVRNPPYANVTLTENLTFATDHSEIADVSTPGGVITAVAPGNAVITVTYTPPVAGEDPRITTIAVTVAGASSASEVGLAKVGEAKVK